MDLEDSDIPISLLKKYIAYAKSRVSPRLTEVIIVLTFLINFKESGNLLNDMYVEDRQKAKQDKLSGKKKHNIPITVRQLEAIIRISESLAKM